MGRNRTACIWIVAVVGIGAALAASRSPGDPPAPPPAKIPAPPAKEAKQEITNSIGMKLVLIRAGNFMMGAPKSDTDAGDDEKPQHRVRITNQFYLGKYEVTLGEFRKFVTATKYKTDAEKVDQGGNGFTGNRLAPWAWGRNYNWSHVGFDQSDGHPVLNVSWNDAVAFCQWLSKQEGEVYRLPTEAEWEWACRAGNIGHWTTGNEERDLEKYANLSDASLTQILGGKQWVPWNDRAPFTSPVGQFAPNRFGLHDMHGNAAEWCSDWYDKKYYIATPVNDPQGPKTSSTKVYRGGCWHQTPKESTSTSRASRSPSATYLGLGFRVARTTPQR